MRLRVVYDTKEVYCEFLPEDFKKVLIEEFKKSNNIEKAFDDTCSRLRAISMRI